MSPRPPLRPLLPGRRCRHPAPLALPSLSPIPAPSGVPSAPIPPPRVLSESCPLGTGPCQPCFHRSRPCSPPPWSWSPDWAVLLPDLSPLLHSSSAPPPLIGAAGRTSKSCSRVIAGH
jgi:hypothetical protein